MHRLFLTFLLHLAIAATALAQSTATLRGQVRDEQGDPLPGASISLITEKKGTVCDEQGRYAVEVPAGRPIVVQISFVGTLPYEETVQLEPGTVRELNVKLRFKTLGMVDIEGQRRRTETGIESLDPRRTRFSPTPQGGVESLLYGQMGVTMRNELSAGYTVRGGNYDENLVYVNDMEVYRPFLVRSGQQEGLSFPNPDMIERIEFSAGGFEARYGDKMSSVLDIRYKRPKEFAGSAMVSLLGAAFHLESPMLNKRLRQVTGFRYRTNQFILQGQDVQGEYRPSYTDIQTYWTYDLTDRTELSFLGLYSSNIYRVVPQNRETEFGPFNMPLQFTVYFDGQERTAFQTWTGAIGLNHQARKDLLLKFIASAYSTHETERFTVQGQYFLDELDRDLSSDTFGEAIRNLGVGTYLDHARNTLDARVVTFAHKGFLERENRFLQWGADVRSEVINDQLSEWTLIDSADYSIPLNQGEDLLLNQTLKSRIDLQTVRTSAYVQNTWRWDNGQGRWWSLVAGLRGQYWSYNQQTVISPRARLTYHPAWRSVQENGDTVDNDFNFWAATGYYYQPPFYREMRRLDGTLNPDIRAQRSIHFLLGMDRKLTIWDRPFKFTTEAYYKYMDDLIPYEVDNVRIRYYGTNNAKGYAVGMDFKLGGQFIDGIDSWMSLGVMSVQENLLDDFYYMRFNAAGDTIRPGYTFDQVAVDSARVEPGWIPRPTDQRVTFSMFFQDEMASNPTYKVHLNLVFATGLPFGPPNADRYADTLRTNVYHRIDIGFSKQLLGAKGQEKTNFLKNIHDMWVSLEVFNLLNINNTINHTWVTDVSGNQYAIPNYLTPRRFNLKFIAWF
jgi:hypothetical protein